MRRMLLTCLIVASCPVGTFAQIPDFHWDFSTPDFASSVGGVAPARLHGNPAIVTSGPTTRKSDSIPEVADADLPNGAVLLDVREFSRMGDPWNRDRTRITMQWQQPVAAITALPRKYADGGLIADRSNPSILRMRCRFSSPEVTTQFLIRARRAIAKSTLE